MARNHTFSFYSKLSLGLLMSFLFIGVLLLLLAQHLTKRYQNEVEQKLHKNLAYHVVKDNDLLKNGEIDKQALKHAFHNMMILGPDFEFYLLDSTGGVQTYSADPSRIKRSSVNLASIQRFLSDERAFPILGDDPRSISKKKIFSVAPITLNNEIKGYLYIIIGGEIYDGITQLLKGSHNMTLAAWSLFFALLFGLIATLLLFAMLTRPLRKLTKDIHAFREEGFESGQLPQSKWDPNSQDEIQRLGSTFNEMAVALNQQHQKVKNTDQLRRELISYVSHDLRTPLANLQGYLETWQLKHTSLDDKESESLIHIALKNAEQMSRLVEQLFELAYLDADDIQLELEPLPIAELVQDVVLKFGLEAREKNIKLNLRADNPSLLVNGNIEKLERVISNLLDNAIRHCNHGDEIDVSIEESKSDSKGLPEVSIVVSDTGVGIPKSELSKVFDSHYRASNSASGRSRNSGLGLAICARIISLHGTKLSVDSTLGEGSCFQFSLATA